MANHNNALTMLPADRGMLERLPERELQLGWFDWLVARRRFFFTLIAATYLLCFNGLWRVGVDSALYRGLARSLANGEGYVFAGEHHRHAYPGLPFMLAGLERLFGDSPLPGLIVMTILALATLWLVDRTIALRFPLWVATVVTIGVGLNYKLLRQSQQLMTDVPFLFGVMLALYGLERLRLLATDARWQGLVKWAVLMIAGLGIAAATRPTFAVLAGAIIAGSAFRLFRPTDGRRWLHAAILSSALLVMLALFLFDPRTRGLSPLGRYEEEFLERLHELPRIILGQINDLLGDDLNDIFFSQALFPISYIASISLLVGAWFVVRRNVVWGLMIFGLVIVTLPLSTVPRYFLMVAPFLWLGWTLLCCKIALRLRPEHVGPVLALALGFPLIVNIARTVGFIIEQRRPDVVALFTDKQRETAFYEKYREGVVPSLRRMSTMIAENSTKRQTIIGPEAHVLAYYADRRVIGERTLFIDREAALTQWPKLVKDAKPDLVIFPYGAYGENDSMMRDLIRRRILVAELSVSKVDDVFLATCNVRPPPPGVNWRTYKAPADSTTKSTTGPSTKRSAVRKGSATQRAEQLAARERRLEREAKIRRAEKQSRLEKIRQQERRKRLEKIEKRERIERRLRIEKRERLERKERQERQKKKKARQGSSGQPATAPATSSATLPAMFPTTLPATFAVALPAATSATR